MSQNGELKVVTSESREGHDEKPTNRGFKRLTCLTKEEEVMISAQTGQPTNKKRWCFKFATLQGDMGFGADTGDLAESLVIYSMDADRFKTGEKYNLNLEA